MPTYNTYDLGDLVRCSGVWTNSSGNAIDPVAVLFKVRTPAGTITSYEYPTNAEIVKDGVGEYHVDVNATVVGTWYYRFYSTGTGQAAEEHRFDIRHSYFD